MSESERQSEMRALRATVDRLRTELEGLRRAMRTRALIEQAKGALVERHRITPEQAFEQLARRSQDENRKVAEVAAELLAEVVPLPAAPPPPPPEPPPPEPVAAPAGPAAPADPGGPATPAGIRYHLAAAALGAATSPEDLVRALTETALAPLGVTAVALAELEPDGALRLVATRGLPPRRASQWQRLPPVAGVPLAEAVRRGRPVWGGGQAARALVPGGTRCALPLLVDGRTIGALALGWPGQVTRDPAIERYLAAIAGLCAARLPQLEPLAGTGERWFRAVLEVLAEPVLLLAPVHDEHGQPCDLRVTHANAAARRAADPVGGRLSELYPELAAAGALTALLTALTEGRPLVRSADPADPGAPTLHAAPVRDGLLLGWEQPEPAHLAAGHGNWHRPPGAGLIECSPEAARLLGHPGATTVPLGAVPPLRELVTLLAERQGPESTEFRAAGLTLRATAEHRPTGIHGVLQDVTEQRRTERALTAARAELAEQRERADSGRRTVRTLQHALLAAPRGPVVPGLELAARYLPAAEEAQIGGDWYDTLTLPDGRVLVAVGDVSGHGLPAAAGMAQVRYALRGLAFTGAGPAELLARLNGMVCHQGSGYIATAICALLEPATRTLHWARAGHPPPLLVDQGRSSVPDSPPGLLLGADPGSRYGQAALRLTPRQTLLFYTDGLLERRGEDPGRGLERLRRAASDGSPATLEGFLDHLLRRLDAPNPYDDTCLLGLRISAGSDAAGGSEAAASRP